MGRCKTICSNLDACGPGEVCMGAQIVGDYLSEMGVCATARPDANCEGRERCYAASDLAHDLNLQMSYRFDRIFGDRTPPASINSVAVVSFLEEQLQSGNDTTQYGELGWCLNELIETEQNSLTEEQSRRVLRRLFDNRTPWNELFTFGQFGRPINLNTNLWGFNHAWSNNCSNVLSKWQAALPTALKAQRIELVDIDRDGIEEVRVGLSVGRTLETNAPVSTWRCYNVEGERITENCSPI